VSFHDETLPAEAARPRTSSRCAPDFCSMRITQDLPQYPRSHGLGADAALTRDGESHVSSARSARSISRSSADAAELPRVCSLCSFPAI